MADNTASLVFDIDSKAARSAASDLMGLEAAAGEMARSMGQAGAAFNKATGRWESVMRRANGQFKRADETVAEYRGEITRLANAYNPLMAATLRYTAVQEELGRAVALGVLTQGQADVALERTAAQMRENVAAANQLAAAQKNNGHHTANVFAQLNDIGMMLAAGQNPFQLALQQGTSLTQVWASMGAEGKTLGGVAGVLRGAIGSMISPMSLLTLGVIAGTAALVQWVFAADDGTTSASLLDDEVSKVKSSISSLSEASSNAIAPLEELRKKYGENAEAVREWLRLDLMRQQAMALETAAPQIAELTALARAYDGINLTAQGAAQETLNLAKMFNMNAVEAGKFQIILRKLTEAKTLQEQAEAAEEVRKFIAQAGTATDTLAAKFGAALQGIAPLVTAAWELATALETASGASAPTATLFDDRQQSIQENRAGVKDARAVALERTQARWLDPDKPKGGGGGGALAQAEKQFQSLRELLQEDTMFQYAEYEKRSIQLANAKAKDLLTEQQYQEMKRQLQMLYFGTEYEQNQVNYDLSLQQLEAANAAKLLSDEAYLIKKRQLQWQYGEELQQGQNNLWSVELDGMAAAFGAMNQLAGGGYDKLLKAQRIFGAASALISTYTGAAEALKLPFPMNIAAMGKVLAAGMGLVNAIKSGSSTPGKGASSTSSTTATQSAKATPTQYVTIDVTGDSWARGMVEGIIEQIQQQTKDGRVVFMGNR